MYLAMAWAFALTASFMPVHGFGEEVVKVIGLFIASQTSLSLMLRIINTALEHDYGMRFDHHYALVSLPILVSVIIDVVVGPAPTGPLFRLALLAVAWRYTTARPTNVLKTLNSVRQQARSATKDAPATAT
jgi:hypothetical protein